MRLEKAMECELYNIFTDDDGNRFVHLLAYIWEYEGESWRITEGTGMIIPIEEFIDEVKKDEEGEYINLLWENTTQYEQEDLTEEDIIDYIDEVNDFLNYDEITIDTPDGDYLKKGIC